MGYRTSYMLEIYKAINWAHVDETFLRLSQIKEVKNTYGMSW